MCLLMVAWSSCSQAEVADSIEGGNGEAPLEVRAVTGAEVDTRAPAAVEMTEGTLGIFRLAEADYTALDNIRYDRVRGKLASGFHGDLCGRYLCQAVCLCSL